MGVGVFLGLCQRLHKVMRTTGTNVIDRCTRTREYRIGVAP